MLFRFILLTYFLAVTACLNAQDVIHLTTGGKIKAKVLEVGLDEVIYKDFANQNGPDLKLKKEEVHKINYKNGSSDFFNASKVPENVSREVVEQKKPIEKKPEAIKPIVIEKKTEELKPAEPKIIETKKEKKTEEPTVFRKKPYAAFGLGFTIPSGDYADNTPTPKSGYAMAGYYIGFDFGFPLHKNFEIGAKLFAAGNNVDVQKYSSDLNAYTSSLPDPLYTSTTIEGYTAAGLLLGGSALFPIQKFTITAKFMAGPMSGRSGAMETTYTNGFGAYLATESSEGYSSGGLGFNLGTGLRYNFGPMFFVMFNIDFIGFKAKFSKRESTLTHYDGRTEKISYPDFNTTMNNTIISIGGGIKFGKK